MCVRPHPHPVLLGTWGPSQKPRVFLGWDAVGRGRHPSSEGRSGPGCLLGWGTGTQAGGCGKPLPAARWGCGQSSIFPSWALGLLPLAPGGTARSCGLVKARLCPPETTSQAIVSAPSRPPGRSQGRCVEGDGGMGSMQTVPGWLAPLGCPGGPDVDTPV